VGLDAAWLHGFVLAGNSGALVPAWDNVCCYPDGSHPCGAGCGMVSSIRAGSNLGALVPS